MLRGATPFLCPEFLKHEQALVRVVFRRLPRYKRVWSDAVRENNATFFFTNRTKTLSVQRVECSERNGKKIK